MSFINLANVDITENIDDMHILVTDGEDVKRVAQSVLFGEVEKEESNVLIFDDNNKTYERGLFLYNEFLKGKKILYRVRDDYYLMVYGVEKFIDDLGDPCIMFSLPQTNSQYYNKTGF